jgi:hypothetical protein
VIGCGLGRPAGLSAKETPLGGLFFRWLGQGFNQPGQGFGLGVEAAVAAV